MALSVKHAHQSTIPDDGSDVGSSAWNADHALTGTVPVANLPVATSSALGIVQPDNTTITISSGIITAASGAGTVTTISIVSTHGFSGTVANPTSTPAVTINMTINAPVLAGDGTSIAAATTTGSGSTVVLQGTPTLTTPVIGVATATSVNKMAITAPTTSSTLAVADGKTLTASNTMTLVATDGQTWTFPASSSTVLTTGNTATITKGYTYTANNIGSPTNASNTTLDGTLGNYQFLTNNVAGFTLTAPASDTAISLLITNGASAGTITWSGFTVATAHGDAFTTTNTNQFLVSVVRINSVSTYVVKALQ
jgi:hypothetical protein